MASSVNLSQAKGEGLMERYNDLLAVVIGITLIGCALTLAVTILADIMGWK